MKVVYPRDSKLQLRESQSFGEVVPFKKIVNRPNKCVNDMLNGMAKTFPGLYVDIKSKVVILPKDNVPDTVAIVTGCGSGHEPFPTGFIGKGMLTAAACGNIFSCPSVNNCLTAIYNASLVKNKGVLVLVLNHGGDTLNFALAVESAREMGIKVDSVIVGDDCAFYKPGVKDTPSRRGLVGILFVIKIASALSLQGMDMDNLKKICMEVVDNMATMGFSTTSCTVPGQQHALVNIAPDEINLGVGIHGDCGIKSIKMTQIPELVKILLDQIIKSLKIQNGDNVCAIVNALGSTIHLEFYAAVADLESQLRARRIHLKRIYAGTMMPSLDTGGMQICLLKVTESNKFWLECLDAKTEAPFWPGCTYSCGTANGGFREIVEVTDEATGPEYKAREEKIFRTCLEVAANKILENELKLNELDSVGDGDTGTTMRRFAEGILNDLDTLPFNSPQACLVKVARLASECMGGTSGGLYSIMLRGAAREAPDWPKALQVAIDSLMQYSPARRGDRTYLDVLLPVSEELNLHKSGEKWNSTLEQALKRAFHGCEETQFMKALVGRACYTRDVDMIDIDSGAFAALTWIEAIFHELMKYDL
ncbi:hypothetical protein LSTR_LSTR010474 [Laodelphax striatellus]|uniref:Triokinase/FMN cyclase n=1 Tax=Laodelphax striatellus TaxID=195883 RepID=A0A482X6I7_LAOST|nr:hypothetical protein LSTR_LSTR010474 [Laodelphax striatellus]